MYQKLYSPVTSPEEAEKLRQIEYVNRYGPLAREQKIFNLIIKGMSNTELTQRTGISQATTKHHT